MSEQVINREQPDEVVPAESEIPVGQQLRAAREARGLQLADIAQTLKLGARQVESLESGDWQALPGQTFIRGCVRNYARLVQIDAAPLMAQLDRILVRPADNLAMHEATPAKMPDGGGRLSKRDRSVVLLGAGLVVLAVLAYFAMPADLAALRDNALAQLDALGRKEAVATPPTPEVPSAPPAANSEPVFPPGSTQQQVMYPQQVAVEAPPSIAPPPVDKPVEAAPRVAPSAAVDKPQLRFLVDKEAWVEVRDRDNKVVFSQRLAAGSDQALAGKGPLALTIGYAPGVRLYWNGQMIDLAPHSKGDVARLVLE